MFNFETQKIRTEYVIYNHLMSPMDSNTGTVPWRWFFKIMEHLKLYTFFKKQIYSIYSIALYIKNYTHNSILKIKKFNKLIDSEKYSYKNKNIHIYRY